MSTVLLVARLLLSGVFGLAAATKLNGHNALRETLGEFGLVSRAAVAGAVLLPAVELAVAALLVPAMTARWAAAGALGLLAAFCVAIARLLVRGDRPDCGCFGGMRSTPIGASTLVRNGVLAAAAAFVVAVGPGKSLADAVRGIDLSPLAIVVAALAAVVVVLAWFAWELFTQHGRLLARVRALEEGASAAAPEGLPVGEPAAPLAELEMRLGLGLPVALVFTDRDCGACEVLVPELERVREEREGELEVVLVANDPAALAAYRIFSVPSATIVDDGGRIATTTASGKAAVLALLQPISRQPEPLHSASV